MSEIVTSLNDSLFQQLQKEKFILLGTVDHESGAPSINAISWVYAASDTAIRFAVDQRSRIVMNAKQHPRVTVSLFADGSVFAIQGVAELVTEALEDVPFKLACFEVKIEAVRDVMFYGSRISAEPEYEKTYDKRAAEKLDQQVFAAMRKA